MADYKYSPIPNAVRKWDPEKYYRLGAYVYMFNAIWTDNKEYGLEMSNGDQVIYNYIREHYAELNSKFNLHLDSNGGLDKFLSDLPELHAQAKKYAAVENGDGKGGINAFLSNRQMVQVLDDKATAVREWHEDVRKASKGKSGSYDVGGGKDRNGPHRVALERAERELENQNIICRRSFGKALLHLGGFALATTATVVSAGALLSYGGFALTAVFGTVFNAAGFGGAVLGGAGTIFGWQFAKRFGKAMIASFQKYSANRKKRREFINGYGEYADKDGKVLGFRKIKQRYYEDLAIQKYLESGNLDKPADRYLRKYLKKAMRRTGPDGEELTYDKLAKESKYYRFVSDAFKENTSDPSKTVYGFDYLKGLLGAAKDMNLNNSNSTQAQTVETEDYLAHGRGGAFDLADLKEEIGKLKNAEGRFTEDSKNKYTAMMNEFTDRIVSTFRGNLFENAFTSSTVSDALDEFKDPVIKERLENTRLGVETDAVENAIKFVDLEAKNTFCGTLSDGVGASVENQLFIKKRNMQNACSKLGSIPAQIPDPSAPGTMMPNPDYVNMQTAISEIEQISTKADTHSTDAEDAISRLTSPATRRVKSYLEFMLKKKRNESRHDDSSLASVHSSVRAEIAGLTDSAKASEVRERIMNAGLSDTARTAALKALTQQVESIERKVRNDNAARVEGLVKGNAFTGFTDFATKISDCKDFEPDKLDDLFKKIKKIKPEEIGKYLMLKFKDKIKANLELEAQSTKFDVEGGNYDAAIANIRKYLRNVSICETRGYIDTWQKDACVSSIESKLVTAFKPFLKGLEKSFLKNPGETITKAEGLLETMENGGFLEILQSNTPGVDEIKRRLVRINDARNLQSLMTAESKLGYGKLVCEDKEDTMKTLRIYFEQDRDDSDPLRKALSKMQEITQKAGYGSPACPELISATGIDSQAFITTTDAAGNSVTSVSTADFATKSYVQLMSAELAKFSISGTTFKYGTEDMSPQDMLAAMFVMKKRTLSMLKSQMYQIYAKYHSGSESISTFVSRPEIAAEIQTNLYPAWESLSKQITEKMRQLQPHVDKEYKGYIPVETCVEDGITPSEYASYFSSKEM